MSLYLVNCRLDSLDVIVVICVTFLRLSAE